MSEDEECGIDSEACQAEACDYCSANLDENSIEWCKACGRMHCSGCLNCLGVCPVCDDISEPD